jgi:hypothetical protein
VRAKPGSLLVTGSKEYCEKIRAWQALCLLSRFITADIVQEVFQKVFDAMSQNMHGQIRYFVEVFTIRCTLSHPIVFNELISQLKSPFLSVQHVSSVMVITGNLLVGERYSMNFSKPIHYTNEELTEMIASILPWYVIINDMNMPQIIEYNFLSSAVLFYRLTSTQGFTRAIAQLLVYHLIPLSTNNPDPKSTEEVLLRSIYAFLHLNPDMERLRKKQQSVFDGYDVDTICTPEGKMWLVSNNYCTQTSCGKYFLFLFNRTTEDSSRCWWGGESSSAR